MSIMKLMPPTVQEAIEMYLKAVNKLQEKVTDEHFAKWYPGLSLHSAKMLHGLEIQHRVKIIEKLYEN